MLWTWEIFLFGLRVDEERERVVGETAFFQTPACILLSGEVKTSLPGPPPFNHFNSRVNHFPQHKTSQTFCLAMPCGIKVDPDVNGPTRPMAQREWEMSSSSDCQRTEYHSSF